MATDQTERNSAPVPHQSAPLVAVRDLTVTFVSRESSTYAVSGVSFDVAAGDVLCIIGESGSGKSVTLRALMGLLPPGRQIVEGSVRVGEHDILGLSERQLRDVRGSRIAMIFQEPMTSLDPVYTIGEQISETIVRHEGCSKRDALRRALVLLQLVKIPSAERRLRAYPHELSGGLRQRAMIAVALSCRPQLLLADEPTTALDATVQIQVLVLLRKLQRELGMAAVFVTHDLGVAAQIADKIAVMYAGRIVEFGEATDILRRPRHPYTMGLLASTVHGQVRGRDIDAIPGNPPDLRRAIRGCAFAARCKHAASACLSGLPPSVTLERGQHVRCFRTADLVELPVLRHSAAG
jgi:peptide/nickel transport system ATP-binding protein